MRSIAICKKKSELLEILFNLFSYMEMISGVFAYTIPNFSKFLTTGYSDTSIMWIHRMTNNNKTNSVALVRKRTIPTERPPLVGEVSGNFDG
jgi:hypothetical protein